MYNIFDSLERILLDATDFSFKSSIELMPSILEEGTKDTTRSSFDELLTVTFIISDSESEQDVKKIIKIFKIRL